MVSLHVLEEVFQHVAHGVVISYVGLPPGRGGIYRSHLSLFRAVGSMGPFDVVLWVVASLVWGLSVPPPLRRLGVPPGSVRSLSHFLLGLPIRGVRHRWLAVPVGFVNEVFQYVVHLENVVVHLPGPGACSVRAARSLSCVWRRALSARGWLPLVLGFAAATSRWAASKGGVVSLVIYPLLDESLTGTFPRNEKGNLGTWTQQTIPAPPETIGLACSIPISRVSRKTCLQCPTPTNCAQVGPAPRTLPSKELAPQGGLSLLPTLKQTLPLIKTEYWDRAGGGGNIRYEW